MKRNFKDWLSKFRNSIANYGYYIDFDKVYRNVNEIKVELNILNSLIGSMNIENDFKTIITKYPEILKCIPILLAVRANEIYAIDGDGDFTYNFKNANFIRRLETNENSNEEDLQPDAGRCSAGFCCTHCICRGSCHVCT